MVSERLRYRLGLRASNAAVPHRNRYREARVDPPWEADDFRDLAVAEDFEDDD